MRTEAEDDPGHRMLVAIVHGRAGMSFASRLTMALAAVVFSAFMVHAAPSQGAALYYAGAAAGLAFAVACLAPRPVAHFLGSGFALGLLAFCAEYVWNMALHGPVLADRRHPCLVDALIKFAVCGVPSALYLWNVRFGFGLKARQD